MKMVVVSLLALLGCLACTLSDDSSFVWKAEVREQLPKLGRSNWIVIGDASFPEHSRPGVRMVVTDAQIPEIFDYVLRHLGRTEHLKLRLFAAQELKEVKNDDAPGADEYRAKMKELLNERDVDEVQQHTLDILLEESQERFVTLVIKSTTDLPYSSIYLELDTGYWSADAEADLRKRIEKNLR